MTDFAYKLVRFHQVLDTDTADTLNTWINGELPWAEGMGMPLFDTANAGVPDGVTNAIGLWDSMSFHNYIKSGDYIVLGDDHQWPVVLTSDIFTTLYRAV